MKKIVLVLLSLCILLLSISAGCTYTTRNFDSTGHKSLSDNGLQLVDSNFVTRTSMSGDASWNVAVAGQIKNNAGMTFHSVKVKINFYDQTGALTGSTMDSVSNLEPGGTWEFRVPAVTSQGYPAAYKVTEISGN